VILFVQSFSRAIARARSTPTPVDRPSARRLLTSVLGLLVVLVLVRASTTLPVLRTLTAAGVAEPTAKALSQVPTVLFVVGVVLWLGWQRETGLRPDRLWTRESLWAFLPLVVPVVAIPLLGLRFAGGDAWGWLLVDAAFVAVWEQVYFRGLLLEQLRRRVARARTAVVLSAMVFGLVHLTNVSGLDADPTFAVVQTLWAFLGGVGMAAVLVRTGSIWPLVAAHFLLDGTERLVFAGQATHADPALMALLLVVGFAYAAYGWVATGGLPAGRGTETARSATVGRT
jgi:membrane protease YdiL (CAAX protease family)